MTHHTRPLRLVVVALGSSRPGDVVAPLLDQARTLVAAAGGALVEPVPVVVPVGTDLPGAQLVDVPAWGDLVPSSGAPGPLGAVQRIVAENVGGLARLVAASRHRRLLATADVVVAADRRSELLVWSLRRSPAALVAGPQAMAYALEERVAGRS